MMFECKRPALAETCGMPPCHPPPPFQHADRRPASHTRQQLLPLCACALRETGTLFCGAFPLPTWFLFLLFLLGVVGAIFSQQLVPKPAVSATMPGLIPS
eukprot:107062-Pelagomonas_calceolata.AAC.4